MTTVLYGVGGGKSEFKGLVKMSAKRLASLPPVGVLVGRFQTPDITRSAHKEVIQYVVDRHNDVLIVLGVGRVPGTTRDPLDVPQRSAMIREAFPNKYLAIVGLADAQSFDEWSENLDALVEKTFPGRQFVFYGGRDNCFDRYDGKMKTKVIPDIEGRKSGTEVREEALHPDASSREFRAGIIYGISKQYPRVHMTVDIAYTRDNHRQILLGKKSGRTKLCFPGGFVDPSDFSLAHAAARELREETGLAIDVPRLRFIDSILIDDWRFRRIKDKIMTALFLCEGSMNDFSPKAGDDLAEVVWCDVDTLSKDDLVPNHGILLEKIQLLRERSLGR